MKLTDFLSDVGRPVAYYPSLAKKLKGVKQAIFLCQLIYWTGKQEDADGWIYKTSSEIEDETGLNWEEQKTARTWLGKQSLIEEHYERLNHQMKFKVCLEAVNKLWEADTQPMTENPSADERDTENLHSVSKFPNWRKSNSGSGESPAPQSEKVQFGNQAKSNSIKGSIDYNIDYNIDHNIELSAPAPQPQDLDLGVGKKGKAAKPAAPRDPNLDHPAVKMHKDILHFNAGTEGSAAIVERVKDLTIWKDTLETWKLNKKSCNPLSLGNILDRYKKNVEYAERQKAWRQPARSDDPIIEVVSPTRRVMRIGNIVKAYDVPQGM